jgi:hypothetical protein
VIIVTAEQAHATIARLAASLPLRPDIEQIRHVLGEAFIEHIDDLWHVERDPNATPQWIRDHTDGILMVLERLYAQALEGHPGRDEFIARMSWLPALVEQFKTRLQ